MYLLTGLLGLVLAVAPFLLGFADNTVALWTSVILGAGVVLTSIFEAISNDTENWEYWTAGILGVAGIIAPFLLGFTAISAAMWTTIIVGGLIAILSGMRIFTKT